ncbi:hypothetical protein CHUAL_014263 [Chamberlinius hualienensis]
MKLSYRWSNKDLVKLMTETDALLEKVPKNICQQYLQRLKQTSSYTLLLPFFIVITCICQQLEFYCFSERTVNYGNPFFIYLQEKYYIDDIFRIGISIPCGIFFTMGIIMGYPVMVTMSFMIQHLKRINETVEYIKIHRHICNYYKLAQNGLGLFGSLIAITAVVGILFFARSVATSPQNVSWATILKLAIFFPFATNVFKIVGNINIELETTLSHLLNFGDSMHLKMRKLGFHEKARLLTKLELYAIFVTLDQPYVKLIGVGKVTPQFVIGFASFVLCYICVLYGK